MDGLEWTGMEDDVCLGLENWANFDVRTCRQSCDVLVDYRGYQILGRKGPEPPAFQAVCQTHTEAGDLEKSAKCYEEVTVRRSLWDCPWPESRDTHCFLGLQLL